MTTPGPKVMAEQKQSADLDGVRLFSEPRLPPLILPPDDEDVRLVLHAALPRCAHCDGTPSTFTRYFEHSGIYQGYVSCSWCHVQVLYNSRDRDKARAGAIAAWSKRVVPAQAADRITSLEAEVERLHSLAKANNQLARRHSNTIAIQVFELRRLREHIDEQADWAETRIQDGGEMGASVWRIALEDITRENRAALKEQPHGSIDPEQVKP